jgi:4-hydroxythreonine-4-phosphate dehydrogenase
MSFSHPSPDATDRLVIALGDPAGIGMEVTLKALADPRLPDGLNPLVVGCRKTLEQTYTRLKSQQCPLLKDPSDLDMDDLPIHEEITSGTPSPESGASSFRWLSHAVSRVREAHTLALVTAPIAKHAWHAAGHDYPGQTERLAELDGVRQASMLFTAVSPNHGWRLNTLLATTHIPLKEVPSALTPELLVRKLDVLSAFCMRFNPTPRLLVAGLNPHAGEQGRLGREEINWLIPALHQWQHNNPHIDLSGPLPPDTCWLSAAKAWQEGGQPESPDGILALYHDQGLIPMKLMAFDEAVNTTLGLSFLRTSPDHGTGFDIAGQGVARSTSMVAAIRAAWDLSRA